MNLQEMQRREGVILPAVGGGAEEETFGSSIENSTGICQVGGARSILAGREGKDSRGM